MTKVYAVGVIKADLSDNAHSFIKESRLWSLFSSFVNAENSILRNEGDIFEYYYNLALIEEVMLADDSKLNPYCISNQWWYHASYVENELVIVPIKKPKSVENVTCFWVG